MILGAMRSTAERILAICSTAMKVFFVAMWQCLFSSPVSIHAWRATLQLTVSDLYIAGKTPGFVDISHIITHSILNCIQLYTPIQNLYTTPLPMHHRHHQYNKTPYRTHPSHMC